MYGQFFNVNTGNARKNFDVRELKVMRTVPEKPFFTAEFKERQGSK